MVFDPSDPLNKESDFELQGLTSSEFGQVQEREEVPSKMPELRSLEFVIHAKVDADLVSDPTTR
jgi:hypothetical protein